MELPLCLNFWLITANILGVRKCRTFTVLLVTTSAFFRQAKTAMILVSGNKQFQNVLSHEKTTLLHMLKTKAQISCTVIIQLINAFVFTSYSAIFLFLKNPKFQDSSYLLWLYNPVCVRLDRNPTDRFSNDVALYNYSSVEVAAEEIRCEYDDNSKITYVVGAH